MGANSKANNKRAGRHTSFCALHLYLYLTLSPTHSIVWFVYSCCLKLNHPTPIYLLSVHLHSLWPAITRLWSAVKCHELYSLLCCCRDVGIFWIGIEALVSQDTTERWVKTTKIPMCEWLFGAGPWTAGKQQWVLQIAFKFLPRTWPSRVLVVTTTRFGST